MAAPGPPSKTRLQVTTPEAASEPPYQKPRYRRMGRGSTTGAENGECSTAAPPPPPSCPPRSALIGVGGHRGREHAVGVGPSQGVALIDADPGLAGGEVAGDGIHRRGGEALTPTGSIVIELEHRHVGLLR